MTGLISLVGRDEDVELLLRRWSRAKTGEGQVALLSGEAGIGKSRLTAEILQRIAAEPHACLRYFCSPQHTDSALHPVIGQMRRAAGLADNDKTQAKLDKLDAMLAQTSTAIEDATLFAEMLSLPNDGRYPALALPPEQRRQRMLDALISLIEALARSRPVLAIFEDVHWCDPTSLEALDRAVDRIKTLRFLLIVTFRPEFDPPWIGRSHVTALTINQLTRRDAGAMVDHIAGNEPMPADVRADIVERTDGIPLFVEEMTKAVLEADSEGAVRRTVAAVPSSARTVPASLHASLMARLDRLGPAKELAQIGAVIGREFPHALLASVARDNGPELESALDRLIQAGLLFRRGLPPHATYLFKHSLLQDAAYGTLLPEPRRALHARIADALESQFGEIAERRPELLARHCTEAGLIEKAAGLWGEAGRRSLERSALVEAADQFRRALGQIAALPATPALRRERIKLQVALITPLIHIKGYAAPETKAAVEQARLLIEQAEALGEPPEDPLLLFSVLYGFWVANYMAFNGDVVRTLAAQFLALAETRGATVPLMIGHRLMGTSLTWTGDIAEGRAHFDRAMALYDPAEHRALGTRFGADAGVTVLSFRSLSLWLLGYPETALAESEQALRDARETGQAPTLMVALFLASQTPIYCGHYAAAAAQAQELIALAEQKGSLIWKAGGLSNQGWVMALTGHTWDAIGTLTCGIAGSRSTGSTIFPPLYLRHLARAHAELGHAEEARCCIGEAMTAAGTTRQTWIEAEVERTAGEIALLSPERDTAKAEAHFERALAIARAQQAKSWELRAAMSMARLRRDQGKRQQAHDLLAPVYGWFTEGFDTLDLKEARALLDELVPTDPGLAVQDDLDSLEGRQRLVISELQHRVKNTLALVQAIARQTMRGAGSIAEANRTLEGRLRALGHAQDALSPTWTSVPIAAIMEKVLAPFRDIRCSIEVAGPDLLLAARPALALALALHELATNATKYGAMSRDQGQVLVEWETVTSADRSLFRLRWSERGGPTVSVPRGSGMGRQLIEHDLAVEFGGAVDLAYAPEGVRLTLEAPLAGVVESEAPRS
jgi:two-component sensor histidine kinase